MSHILVACSSRDSKASFSLKKKNTTVITEQLHYLEGQYELSAAQRLPPYVSGQEAHAVLTGECCIMNQVFTQLLPVSQEDATLPFVSLNSPVLIRPLS